VLCNVSFLRRKSTLAGLVRGFDSSCCFLKRAPPTWLLNWLCPHVQSPQRLTFLRVPKRESKAVVFVSPPTQNASHFLDRGRFFSQIAEISLIRVFPVHSSYVCFFEISCTVSFFFRYLIFSAPTPVQIMLPFLTRVLPFPTYPSLCAGSFCQS